MAFKKLKKNSFNKKRTRVDSDSSVVESSKDSVEEHRSSRKYCKLHGKYNHSMDQSKNLCILVSNNKVNKKNKPKYHHKSNKELNALVDKRFKKIVRTKKRQNTEKELQYFP